MRVLRRWSCRPSDALGQWLSVRPALGASREAARGSGLWSGLCALETSLVLRTRPRREDHRVQASRGSQSVGFCTSHHVLQEVLLEPENLAKHAFALHRLSTAAELPLR